MAKKFMKGLLDPRLADGTGRMLKSDFKKTPPENMDASTVTRVENMLLQGVTLSDTANLTSVDIANVEYISKELKKRLKKKKK